MNSNCESGPHYVPENLEFRDGDHLREIMSSVEAVNRAQDDLRHAIALARKAGDSWAAIGAALGVTKQAAHEKYHDLDP